MDTLFWLGILAMIVVLGIRLGFRRARAGQHIHRAGMAGDRPMAADDMQPDRGHLA